MRAELLSRTKVLKLSGKYHYFKDIDGAGRLMTVIYTEAKNNKEVNHRVELWEVSGSFSINAKDCSLTPIGAILEENKVLDISSADIIAMVSKLAVQSVKDNADNGSFSDVVKLSLNDLNLEMEEQNQ